MNKYFRYYKIKNNPLKYANLFLLSDYLLFNSLCFAEQPVRKINKKFILILELNLPLKIIGSLISFVMTFMYLI